MKDLVIKFNGSGKTITYKVYDGGDVWIWLDDNKKVVQWYTKEAWNEMQEVGKQYEDMFRQKLMFGDEK